MKLRNKQQSHNTRPTIELPIHSIGLVGETILLGIVDAAHEQDVNVLCFEGGSLCGPVNGQGNVLFELIPRTINGLIFWGGGSYNFVSHTKFTRFCNRYRPRPMVTIVGKAVEDIPCLSTNSRQGTSRIVNHLIQTHGCRRIAYIHGGKHVEASLRYQGYVDTLADHDIPLDPALVVGYRQLAHEKYGVMAIDELLDERRLSPPNDVEAIVAADDTLAMGAIKALQQRGFHVPGDVAVAGFDDKLRAARAGDIIVKMEHTLESSAQAHSSEWLRQLVEGFLAELCADSPGAFLNTLRQIITTLVITAAGTEHKLSLLHNIITSLRQTIIPYYKTSHQAREHAEHLWHQARILIGEAQGRMRAQHTLKLEQQTEDIQSFGKSLITTFDIQGLKETLIKGLPVLGIKSCSLMLYEDSQPYAYPQPAPEWSQVLLSYDEHGPHEMTSTACRFLSHQLLPNQLLPRDRRYTFEVEALYFLDQQIGFIMLEMGPRKGSVYSLLRSQISSAPRHANL